MPVQVRSQTKVQRLSEDVFKEIAFAVTGAAFDVHSQYGRFFGEKTYKDELASACRAKGLSVVEVEVPIVVTFQDFQKSYYMDLLINGGEESVVQPVSVIRDGVEVSSHYVRMLGPDVAFKLTALPERLDVAEEHMRRFLHHTRLRAIQWINLHQHEVRLVTLEDGQ